MREIYNDEAFIAAMVAEGRDEEIIRDALKTGCVGGLPGAGEFVCPICGGEAWGTYMAPQGRPFHEGEGHCSGWLPKESGYEHCSFAWRRSDDAWVFGPGGHSLRGITLRADGEQFEQGDQK